MSSRLGAVLLLRDVPSTCRRKHVTANGECFERRHRNDFERRNSSEREEGTADELRPALKTTSTCRCAPADASSHVQLRKQSWKAFALLLDRIFFMLYLIVVSVSIATLFPRPVDDVISSENRNQDLVLCDELERSNQWN